METSCAKQRPRWTFRYELEPFLHPAVQCFKVGWAKKKKNLNCAWVMGMKIYAKFTIDVSQTFDLLSKKNSCVEHPTSLYSLETSDNTPRAPECPVGSRPKRPIAAQPVRPCHTTYPWQWGDGYRIRISCLQIKIVANTLIDDIG